MPSDNVVMAVIAFLTAGVTSTLTWWVGHRKATADNTIALTTGFDTIYRRLKEDNDALRDRDIAWRRQVEALEAKIDALETKIDELHTDIMRRDGLVR